MTTRERFHQLIDELPEEEATTYLGWIENARQNGLNAERAEIENRQKSMSELTPEERARRVRSARGAFAHLPNSSEDFMRRKQEEIDLEEAKWQRNQSKG